MKIDNMTIGEFKEIQSLFNQPSGSKEDIASDFMNEFVIIRTYSAGVWFGKLVKKAGTEVILQDARRMWKWWAKESISLSGVAVYGINQGKSKICPAVDKQWLDVIEIISLTDVAIKSISEAKDVEA